MLTSYHPAITLTVPSTITTEKLATLLSIRTKLPTKDLRLVHAGSHLSPTDVLVSKNIRNESTITLATPLRGGMPPKKIRCGATDSGVRCSEGVSRIVGECGFCGGCFCGKHRLLEDHKCKGLEDVSVHPAFVGFASPVGTPLTEGGNTPGKGKSLLAEEGKDQDGYFVVKAVRTDEELDGLERLVKLDKQSREKEIAASELSKEEMRELSRLSSGKGMKEELGRLAGGKMVVDRGVEFPLILASWIKLFKHSWENRR